MPDWDTMRALLEGIPALPGARCKGRCDLFERTTGEDRAAGRTTTEELHNARRDALRLCNNGCPALGACCAWLGALPAGTAPPRRRRRPSRALRRAHPHNQTQGG